MYTVSNVYSVNKTVFSHKRVPHTGFALILENILRQFEIRFSERFHTRILSNFEYVVQQRLLIEDQFKKFL